MIDVQRAIANAVEEETHTAPLAAERHIATEVGVIFRGVEIIGFTSPQEEMVQAYMSRIPPELIVGVHCVKSDPSLNAIHGRYDVETKTVFFNPHTFVSRQKMGQGFAKINHAQLTLVHEFMHALYSSLPEKMQDSWRELSGWMRGWQKGQAQPYEEKRPGWPHKTSNWTHREGASFTRHYAEKNDDEDFADAAAFFLLGKAQQAGTIKKRWLAKLLLSMVRRYPQASLESPTNPS